jgi:PAS domain S-box-containing protein
MEMTSKLYKLLWDYDPNGLLVLDPEMRVVLVNPALCRMFKLESAQLIGRDAKEILGGADEFLKAFLEQVEVAGHEQEYPQFDLYVRKVIFPIPGEPFVASIWVDLTEEWRRQEERRRIKQEAMQDVRRVVDQQMKVAQEVAGLLGEATAETKVSLLRLLEMIRKENV